MTLALLKPVLAAIHRRAVDARFARFTRTWAEAAGSRPAPTRIIVSGFINDVLGIGQAGRLTVAAMSAQGFDVVTEDLRPLDRGLLTRRPVGLPDAPIWLIHANPPEARIALLRHSHAIWQDRYRIGYWVWESSIAPDAWTETARWFHEIWTPSQSARDAFAAAFEKGGRMADIAKLRVLPHPVPAQPIRPSDNNAVRALTLFDPRSDFDRKNPRGAIDAWLMAFPTPGAGRLIVKSLAQAAGHPRFEALRALAGHRPDIEFQAETLDARGTETLIAGCDILISLHRAEGFGLPLAEAMAGGLAVIATGWSGNMQFMTAENSIPLPYRLVPASRAYNGPSARWAEPDVPAAAEALRQLVGDAGLRQKLGQRAREDIAALSGAWVAGDLFA